MATPDSRVIVFSHGNGFPGGTYRQLFDHWRQAGWTVLAPHMLGHDPHYPVKSNWTHLRDELIAFVESQAPGRAVHLVGHSLGGYLSLLAALRRPDLALSVTLLDSPVLAGWRAGAVAFAKATGLIRRVSPGRIASRRRQHWASRDEALEHFATRKAFAAWDPQVLRDYVECGTHPAGAGKDQGVALSFRRDIEARIYNALPHRLGTLLRRHPARCPVRFVGGTRSDEVQRVGLQATRALTRGHMRWLPGTHLFPMEQPGATALAVMEMLGDVNIAPQARDPIR